jgi:hypothetical protein
VDEIGKNTEALGWPPDEPDKILATCFASNVTALSRNPEGLPESSGEGPQSDAR